ncbi:MAG: hypothetical protein J0652_08505 [Desulfobulbaceae bacterium]|jgi:SulP family sulfate permease|nr:hypothetical protein [Desulfobulbaceae bacterium]
MEMEPCVTFRSIPPLDISTQFTAIRFDGSLYFANVTHSEDAVLAAVAGSQKGEISLSQKIRP